MERSINSLTGYRVGATDGEIGEVEDFYFDDETWTIRYVVAKTGGWLSGRKVLLATTAISERGIKGGLFPINLTKEQISDSPDIDTEKPVSRQQEAMLNQHHWWENYWGSGSYGGEMGIANRPPVRIRAEERDPNEDIHLQNIVEVDGYTIHATDGEIGHINDFIVDDKTWELTHLVVDTSDWIGGKKVLVEVAHVHTISFLSRLVYLDIAKADIETSKLYDEDDFEKE
jgi:sporulation protein YlmC with PRC-barrel domain